MIHDGRMVIVVVVVVIVFQTGNNLKRSFSQCKRRQKKERAGNKRKLKGKGTGDFTFSCCD
jgi:hypothetical protein